MATLALISGEGPERGWIARRIGLGVQASNLMLDAASPAEAQNITPEHLAEARRELAAAQGYCFPPLPNGIQLTGQMWLRVDARDGAELILRKVCLA